MERIDMFGAPNRKNINLTRYSVTLLLFAVPWIIGVNVYNTPLGFFGGIGLALLFLYVSKEIYNGLPTLYLQRLGERRIQFFLLMLALAHIIPGAIIAEALWGYLWVFALAAIIHIGLETFVIINRKPKPPKIVRPLPPPGMVAKMAPRHRFNYKRQLLRIIRGRPKHYFER